MKIPGRNVAVKDSSITRREKKLFENAISTFNLPTIDDHSVRVVKQAGNSRWIPAMHTSETGKDLIKAGLAGVIIEKGERELYLTPKGVEVRNWLITQAANSEITNVLQNVVLAVRTAWATRPRVDRFTFYDIRYRLRMWWRGTDPVVPMFTEEFLNAVTNFQNNHDEVADRRMWMESNFSAFWLCPTGPIDGANIHDEWLAFLEGKPSDVEREKYRHKVAGLPYTPPRPSTEEWDAKIAQTKAKAEAKLKTKWSKKGVTTSSSGKYEKLHPYKLETNSTSYNKHYIKDLAPASPKRSKLTGKEVMQSLKRATPKEMMHRRLEEEIDQLIDELEAMPRGRR